MSSNLRSTVEKLCAYLEGYAELDDANGHHKAAVGTRKVVSEARAALADETTAVHGLQCDLTGWVCSVCHGWNVARLDVCQHDHSALKTTLPQPPPAAPLSKSDEWEAQTAAEVRAEIGGYK